MYFVNCPYCGKKVSKLTPNHLKMHGKTKANVLLEHPEIPRSCMEPLSNIGKKHVDKAAIEYGNYREARARQHGCISKVKSREV